MVFLEWASGPRTRGHGVFQVRAWIPIRAVRVSAWSRALPAASASRRIPSAVRTPLALVVLSCRPRLRKSSRYGLHTGESGAGAEADPPLVHPVDAGRRVDEQIEVRLPRAADHPGLVDSLVHQVFDVAGLAGVDAVQIPPRWQAPALVRADAVGGVAAQRPGQELSGLDLIKAEPGDGIRFRCHGLISLPGLMRTYKGRSGRSWEGSCLAGDGQG